MIKLAMAMGAIAFFTMPALAASEYGDNSIVVAENEGVSVHVEGGRDHDRDRHVVIHHRDHDEDRDRRRYHDDHHDHEDRDRR